MGYLAWHKKVNIKPNPNVHVSPQNMCLLCLCLLIEHCTPVIGLLILSVSGRFSLWMQVSWCFKQAWLRDFQSLNPSSVNSGGSTLNYTQGETPFDPQHGLELMTS